MKGPKSAAARQAISLYSAAPLGDRLHVRIRWWSCPIEQVAAQVPTSGKVLDVGCGHGLLATFLAVQSPDRRIVGVDVDEHKIRIARQAAAALGGSGERLSFRPIDGDVFKPGSWDAVAVNDVLYLLEASDRRLLLDQCAMALAPGGALVIKEMDHRPAWKYRLTVAQETISTKVLGITAGERVSIAEPAELVAQLRDHGLDVTGQRIDHGYPHPHVLLVARRPA